MSSSTNKPPPPPNNNRYITTHDPSTHLSIFSTISPQAPGSSAPNGSLFTLDYTTSSTPVSLAPTTTTTTNKDNNNNNEPADISLYTAHVSSATSLPPAYRTPTGTVLRHLDFPPAVTSPMHRTPTLDYIVVIQGLLELILDSGETRLLHPGDTVVQRGTMHAWRNPSPDTWCRAVGVLVAAEGLETVLGREDEVRDEYRGVPEFDADGRLKV